MKTEQNIENKIFDIIKKIINNNSINKDSLFLDEGWLDSLSTIELLTEIEKSFNITIENDQLTHENFNSLNKITELVVKKCR
tara:strand:- start:699 stop:944 length:246 start_codon:yes stop_codon:yes gene_type:complete